MPLRTAHLALNSSMNYFDRRSRQGLMMALDILVKNVALPGHDGACDVGLTGGCFASMVLRDAIESRVSVASAETDHGVVFKDQARISS
jgi:hypothetical protein